MVKKDLSKKESAALSKVYFQVETQLGFPVKTTESYWKIITKVKHPSIAKKEKEVKKCLSSPDEIRISKKDKKVYLFYHRLKSKYICVVVKYMKKESFIVTSYITDKIKEGELKWKK